MNTIEEKEQSNQRTSQTFPFKIQDIETKITGVGYYRDFLFNFQEEADFTIDDLEILGEIRKNKECFAANSLYDEKDLRELQQNSIIPENTVVLMINSEQEQINKKNIITYFQFSLAFTKQSTTYWSPIRFVFLKEKSHTKIRNKKQSIKQAIYSNSFYLRTFKDIIEEIQERNIFIINTNLSLADFPIINYIYKLKREFNITLINNFVPVTQLEGEKGFLREMNKIGILLPVNTIYSAIGNHNITIPTPDGDIKRLYFKIEKIKKRRGSYYIVRKSVLGEGIKIRNNDNKMEDRINGVVDMNVARDITLNTDYSYNVGKSEDAYIIKRAIKLLFKDEVAHNITKLNRINQIYRSKIISN